MSKSTSRLFSFCSRACLLLACSSAGLAACSGDGKDRPTSEETEAPTGTISLNLTARGISGALYRLRQGTFQIEQIGNNIPTPGEPPFPSEPQPMPVPFPPRPPIATDDPAIGGAGGSFGMAGSPGNGGTSTGGRAGSGGVAGAGGFPGNGGFAGTAGMAGSSGTGGFAGTGTGGSGGGFVTFLFTEDDPLATTLETNLPTGQYLITLFDGWFLERVQGGEVEAVNARLVSPQTLDFFISANEETFVSYRFETNGDIVEFGDGRLIVDIEVDEVQGGGGGDPRLGVMENSIEGLPFSLEETLGVALANAGSMLDPVSAYHAIIDSYATTADGRDPTAIHCDEEITDGAATLNGFPIQCPRREALQFDNIGVWFPTAAVSRLDLAPTDGSNCGQQRLIFSNNANGRMFIIVEAQIPNPDPSCGVAACAPLAAFWQRLGEIQDPFLRGALLREAFLTGSPELAGAGFAPFMNAAHLGPDGGQIRTNNFDDFIWTLREFHFQDVNAAPVPVPVAESPHGRLWNDLSGLPQTAACQESFLRAAELGLLTDNLSAMSFPVDQACKNSESANDGSEDYAFHLGQGSGQFVDQLDQLGAPFGLSAFDLANRARFTGSCMGCHIESSFLDLGNGLVAPPREDFVHVNEFIIEPCGNGGTCFGVSGALSTTFLPHRQRVSQALLQGGVCGEVPPPIDPPVDPLPPSMGSGGGNASGGSGAVGAPPRPPIGIPGGSAGGGTAPVPPAGEEAVVYTLGGQLADVHAH